MRNLTTPAVPTLESITFDRLHRVSGGCHPKPAPANVQQTQVYAPQIYAPQICMLPAYAPRMYAPRRPMEASTEVSIG